MKKRSFVRPIVACLCILLPNAALAHYLWVEVDASPKGSRVANLYFEESPKPGDGSYLDHFLGKSDVWIRTIEDPSPDPVRATEVKKGENRWMRVDVPSASEFSVDAYGKFGVYEYGNTQSLIALLREASVCSFP